MVGFFGWLMVGNLIFLVVDFRNGSGISSFLLDGRRISRNFVVEECMVVTITSTTFMGGGTFRGLVVRTEAVKTQLTGTYGITAVLD